MIFMIIQYQNGVNKKRQRSLNNTESHKLIKTDDFYKALPQNKKDLSPFLLIQENCILVS